MARSVRKQVNPALRAISLFGNLGGFLFPLGVVALISVPAVLIYQTMQWLKLGAWPALSFADGLRFADLPPPHFSSPMMQQTMETLLASPLALVLLFGIGGPLFLYARFAKWLEK